MSNRIILSLQAAAALGAILLLGGCSTYDYLQHSDRVAYGAGDAVKANIEAQTTNPSKASTYSTAGLGKNGEVVSQYEVDE